MANKTFATNDQTGSVFQLSRCKYLDHKKMTKKIKAANKYNLFISQPTVSLSKTGRIKDASAFLKINGVSMT